MGSMVTRVITGRQSQSCQAVIVRPNARAVKKLMKMAQTWMPSAYPREAARRAGDAVYARRRAHQLIQLEGKRLDKADTGELNSKIEINSVMTSAQVEITNNWIENLEF